MRKLPLVAGFAGPLSAQDQDELQDRLDRRAADLRQTGAGS
jgi:hypothetical protein